METNHNQSEAETKKSEAEEKKSAVKPKKQHYKSLELAFETRSHALPKKELIEYTEQEVEFLA